MKSCEGCGLPAPLDAAACALCGRPYERARPETWRLAATPTGYRWTADGRDAVTAAYRDGTWDVTDSGTGRVGLTLVPVNDAGISKVALVDHEDRSVATFSPGEAGATGIVRDSYQRVLVGVRGDGPTGIHVTDTTGDVVALASTFADGQPGLDILLMGAAAGPRRRLVLALMLALELLRLDDLHPVG